MNHNSYSDGNVQNLEFINDGQRISIGVVEPGEYSFTSEASEHVTCITGKITINGEPIGPGQSATIDTNSPFTLSVEQTSSYLCKYSNE